MQELQNPSEWSADKLAVLEQLKGKYKGLIAARFKNLDIDGEWVYAFLKPLDTITKIKLWESITNGRGQTAAYDVFESVLLPESDIETIKGHEGYVFGCIEVILDSVQIAIPHVKKN